jgi:23S rRNA (uracil1939-C5)-methyltransferase
MVVFCSGPLPGERARVAIAVRKPNYAVAELRKLLETSPQRVDPFCPVFGICGGCQVQHLAYAAQLEWKRSMVAGVLARIGGIGGVDVRPTIAAAGTRSYRNKMALVVEHREGGNAIGFYRARSHDLVAIDACPVVNPLLNEYIGKFAAAGPDEPLGIAIGQATHLIARQSRGGRAVLSVTTPAESRTLAEVAPQVLQALPGSCGIANSYEPRSANAVMGRRERRLAGAMEIEETVGDIVYRVSPGSFFQINVEVVERIFEALAPEIANSRSVVDLYCGMGTFSLLFARAGARVIGVEENRRAVDEAGANAKRNALDAKTQFVAQRVEQWVASSQGRALLKRADAVFLDPPRKGSDETTLRAIADAGVSRVLYLSCDPATLARDLRLLVANGYALRSVQPFDMFPQTGHVETLASLARV